MKKTLVIVVLLGVFISQFCSADENRIIQFKDPYTILNEYKLSREPDGSYEFLGKKYKKIEDISEEDVVRVPAMQIVEKTKNGVRFRSFAAYGSLSNVKIKGENFAVLGLSSLSKGGEVGQPALPYYGQFIAVPKNAKVDLVIDNVKIEPVPGEYKVYPVQPSLPLTEDAKEAEFTIDKNAYKQNRYIGEDKSIRIAADVIVRGKRLI